VATHARTTAPLNKTGLGEAVAAELGLSLKEGVRVVDAVLNVITRTVTAGHAVTVSNFGTWAAVHRPTRTARNPQTGEPVVIPARQEFTFRMSDRLREIVQAADPATATIRKHPKTAKNATP
jgi:nucleoid DNA-binding protein